MTTTLSYSHILSLNCVVALSLLLIYSSTNPVQSFTTTTITTVPTYSSLLSSSSGISKSYYQQQQQQRLFSSVTDEKEEVTEKDDIAVRLVENDDIMKIKKELKQLLTGIVSDEKVDDDNKSVNKSNGKLYQQEQETFYIDPITKESFLYKTITPSQNLYVGGGVTNQRIMTYEYISNNNTYIGTSDTYINLLEPNNIGTVQHDNNNNENNIDDDATTTRTRIRSVVQEAVNKLVVPFVPPPLRSTFVQQANSIIGTSSTTDANDSSSNTEYIPMRDLFTSPFVSYAYERGWRNSFQRAGFPGVEVEAIMAMDYFRPSFTKATTTTSSTVLVDMSCATGLFTRKFIYRAANINTNNRNTTTSRNYYPTISRIIGADYSDAMLREARFRFQQDPNIQNLIRSSSYNMEKQISDGNNHIPSIELVRCDVGCIPIGTNLVNAVHAGAAMHCWPDLPLALSEIYRILQPNGGRYFATTFLSSYFNNLQRTDTSNNFQPSQQTFQYFSSTEQLRTLLINAGFASNQIQIDVIGTSCVIIKCEK